MSPGPSQWLSPWQTTLWQLWDRLKADAQFLGNPPPGSCYICVLRGSGPIFCRTWTNCLIRLCGASGPSHSLSHLCLKSWPSLLTPLTYSHTLGWLWLSGFEVLSLIFQTFHVKGGTEHTTGCRTWARLQGLSDATLLGTGRSICQR